MQTVCGSPVLFSKGAMGHSLQRALSHASYQMWLVMKNPVEAGGPWMKISTQGLLGAGENTRPSVSNLGKIP